MAEVPYRGPCEDMLSHIFILSYLFYILEKKEISGPEALDIMRNGYRVYLEDQKSKFKWESMIVLSAVQEKIIDVVIKRA